MTKFTIKEKNELLKKFRGDIKPTVKDDFYCPCCDKEHSFKDIEIEIEYWELTDKYEVYFYCPECTANEMDFEVIYKS